MPNNIYYILRPKSISYFALQFPQNISFLGGGITKKEIK